MKIQWRFYIIFQKRKVIISIHPGPSSAKNIDIEAIDTFVTKDALILICYAKGPPEALSHKIDFEIIIGFRNISQINNKNEEAKNIQNSLQGVNTNNLHGSTSTCSGTRWLIFMIAHRDYTSLHTLK